MNVIDVWAQHPTPRLIEQPFLDTLKRWIGSDIPEIPAEFTVSAMESANVEKCILSAWYGPQGDLISNDDVLEMIQKHPGKFLGMVGVDLLNPVQALRTMRKYVKEHGFVGLRIIQWLWELPCTHALYYPLLAECVELDIPVCMQVGLTGPLRSSETGRPIHIERIALDFPDLKIVCGHIGAPWHNEMIAFATKFPNVYIDTSAYKPKRYPKELVHYMKNHGKKKVMFGSNFPMIFPQVCMEELDLLDLNDEVKSLFLYENAKRVFKL